MYKYISLLFWCIIAMLVKNCSSPQQKATPIFGLAIHGGAGSMVKGDLSAELESAYEKDLNKALLAGFEILNNGGQSLDAVQVAINIMENSPVFNAGKGAVFASNGKNELDAAIMDGKTLNSGAVTGVQHIKNPIDLARLVMEKSPHVFMAQEGAEQFAVLNGMQLVPESYFFTERRWKQLQRSRNTDEKSMLLMDSEQKHFGTVGAVALDKRGNLAAGTSTGGMNNKKFGRIGDAPVIGAGTYANNQTCAVSATGHGEYFIRSVVAHDISALMEYRYYSLEEAANIVIMKKLDKLGGTGGIIAIDHFGNIAMTFNSKSMLRGYYLSTAQPLVKIYSDIKQ
jgi:beta-aspartyl-peptidase (threonine type)